jgi:hypothetical protein
LHIWQQPVAALLPLLRKFLREFLAAGLHRQRRKESKLYSVASYLENLRIYSTCLHIQLDLLSDMPPLIRRVCSGYAPPWGVLRTQLV